jgi:hypothetical protein
MVVFENRSGAAIWAVSTGSADGCIPQPGMGQIAVRKKKTLVPGALGRGFLVCVRHAIDSPTNQEVRATGGKPASGRAVRCICRTFVLAAK